MGDELPLFGNEETAPVLGDSGKVDVFKPRPRKIRKRARPTDGSPPKQAKKIKVEQTGAPLVPKECSGLDREAIKRRILVLEKEYDKITFGLKIVRDHMGRMMTQISEFSKFIYDTEK